MNKINSKDIDSLSIDFLNKLKKYKEDYKKSSVFKDIFKIILGADFKFDNIYYKKLNKEELYSFLNQSVQNRHKKIKDTLEEDEFQKLIDELGFENLNFPFYKDKNGIERIHQNLTIYNLRYLLDYYKYQTLDFLTKINKEEGKYYAHDYEINHNFLIFFERMFLTAGHEIKNTVVFHDKEDFIDFVNFTKNNKNNIDTYIKNLSNFYLEYLFKQNQKENTLPKHEIIDEFEKSIKHIFNYDYIFESFKDKIDFIKKGKSIHIILEFYFNLQYGTSIIANNLLEIITNKYEKKSLIKNDNIITDYNQIYDSVFFNEEYVKKLNNIQIKKINSYKKINLEDILSKLPDYLIALIKDNYPFQNYPKDLDKKILSKIKDEEKILTSLKNNDFKEKISFKNSLEFLILKEIKNKLRPEEYKYYFSTFYFNFIQRMKISLNPNFDFTIKNYENYEEMYNEYYKYKRDNLPTDELENKIINSFHKLDKYFKKEDIRFFNKINHNFVMNGKHCIDQYIYHLQDSFYKKNNYDEVYCAIHSDNFYEFILKDKLFYSFNIPKKLDHFKNIGLTFYENMDFIMKEKFCDFLIKNFSKNSNKQNNGFDFSSDSKMIHYENFHIQDVFNLYSLFVFNKTNKDKIKQYLKEKYSDSYNYFLEEFKTYFNQYEVISTLGNIVEEKVTQKIKNCSLVIETRKDFGGVKSDVVIQDEHNIYQGISIKSTQQDDFQNEIPLGTLSNKSFFQKYQQNIDNEKLRKQLEMFINPVKYFIQNKNDSNLFVGENDNNLSKIRLNLDNENFKELKDFLNNNLFKIFKDFFIDDENSFKTKYFLLVNDKNKTYNNYATEDILNFIKNNCYIDFSNGRPVFKYKSKNSKKPLIIARFHIYKQASGLKLNKNNKSIQDLSEEEIINYYVKKEGFGFSINKNIFEYVQENKDFEIESKKIYELKDIKYSDVITHNEKHMLNNDIENEIFNLLQNTHKNTYSKI